VSVEKAFLDADGDFDVCINCAAETRYGQSEEVNNARFSYAFILLVVKLLQCSITDCLVTCLLLSCH